MSQSVNPRKARRINWDAVVNIATVIIKVGGRILQDWIMRGGHL